MNTREHACTHAHSCTCIPTHAAAKTHETATARPPFLRRQILHPLGGGGGSRAQDDGLLRVGNAGTDLCSEGEGGGGVHIRVCRIHPVHELQARLQPSLDGSHLPPQPTATYPFLSEYASAVYSLNESPNRASACCYQQVHHEPLQNTHSHMCGL